MTIGSVAAATALALCAVSPGRVTFVLALLAMELASSFVLYSAAFVAIVQIGVPRPQRSITHLTLIAGFASTLFWPLTSALHAHLTWREVYLLFAALNLGLCLPIHAWLMRLSRRHATAAPQGEGRALAHEAGAPLDARRGRVAFLLMLAGFATEQQSLAFPASTYPNRMVAIGPVMVPEMQIITILALIVCAVGIYLLIQKTRIGAAMRAVGWNEVAAGLGGVNARLVILLTAFLAGATSGLAGVLGGIATSNVSFTLGEGLMLKGFAGVVVGGFDDVRGTAIAGICLGIIEVFVGQYVSTAMRDGVTYALLLLFLIVRPRGLFGSASFLRA